MLRSLNELRHYRIHAVDGDLGTAHDFFFDDHSWAVRYLVIDTRRWLMGRRVLVPPDVIEHADWASYRLHLNLTKQQIQDSPEVDTNMPVSRQQQEHLTEHYRVPTFFGTHGPMVSATGVIERQRAEQAAAAAAITRDGDHLRSVREVVGYHIEATDGAIGHVDDFVVDDESWTIRYCVVDTRNWLPAKSVIIPPLWIENIDWTRAQVNVLLTQEEIKGSPPFNPDTPVNREYETRLYDYYGRPRYWE